MARSGLGEQHMHFRAKIDRKIKSKILSQNPQLRGRARHIKEQSNPLKTQKYDLSSLILVVEKWD